MINLRVEKLIAECDKHLARINHAYGKMAVFMPLDAARYQVLNDDEIEHIDQFLFRFAKLQDAMGEKLFILLLEFLLEENPKNKPCGCGDYLGGQRKYWFNRCHRHRSQCIAEVISHCAIAENPGCVLAPELASRAG